MMFIVNGQLVNRDAYERHLKSERERKRRHRAKRMHPCARCGEPCHAQSTYCVHCVKSADRPPAYCVDCQADIDYRAVRCPRCAALKRWEKRRAGRR